MNSEEALKVVERLITRGKVSRVSSSERVTKGIVFQTASGRHFAVTINNGPAHSVSQQTKLVFERAPAGQALDWDRISGMPDITVSDYQFESSLLKLRGANLEPGKQISALVTSEVALGDLMDWYADADGLQTGVPMLNRADVEAAMDRYDLLGPEGFKATYPQFDEAVDYWVRPSQNRVYRRYPSRSVAAVALGVSSLPGGWVKQGAAASLLHNLGYVIVGEDNQPTPVPAEQYPYLITGADRIRAYAMTNYIAPARGRGDTSVTIVAGKLHNEIGLTQSWANVCQALRGARFLRYASVSAPDESGPLASTTTAFTYHLKEVEIFMSPLAPTTTNLILYGPPGTGKTYETAAAAVQLCLGEEQVSPLLVESRRDDLMKAYHQLAEAGRIEFITFHQSYSYEDFVEGLRPTTDSLDATSDADEMLSGEEDSNDASPASSGFHLRSRDGIFKRICERARRDLGGAHDGRKLDRRRSVFKIALGRKGIEEERISAGLDGNVIHLGWGGDIDWSDERFKHFEQIRREWKENKDPEASGKDPNIEMTYAFRSDMQIGDYVVLSDGRDTFRAFGEVTGDYYFDGNAPYHPHRRRVEWIWKSGDGVERDTFYPNFFRRQAIYRLRQAVIDWDALEAIVLDQNVRRGVPRPYVLVIDEINRANISKVFGELITLLEPDKRVGQMNELRVKLPYSDGPPFGVPPNLHIIGTMNTADRSIALLDTALRRRFAFRELMPNPSLLKKVDGIDLAVMLGTINERIEYLFDREHQIGHAYFINCKSRQDVENVMRHKVIPLLAEYFYEDWGKVAAILGDADDGDSDHKGAFLDRKKLRTPNGMGAEADGRTRFRWSVRDIFDFSNLANG